MSWLIINQKQERSNARRFSLWLSCNYEWSLHSKCVGTCEDRHCTNKCDLLGPIHLALFTQYRLIKKRNHELEATVWLKLSSINFVSAKTKPAHFNGIPCVFALRFFLSNFIYDEQILFLANINCPCHCIRYPVLLASAKYYGFFFLFNQITFLWRILYLGLLILTEKHNGKIHQKVTGYGTFWFAKHGSSTSCTLSPTLTVIAAS